MERSPEKRPWLRKSILILACFTGPILIVRIVGIFTGWLQFYSVPGVAEEPVIETGSHLFATNLLEPVRFDHVCFHQREQRFGASIWVKRVCGIEGDTIQIVHGNLMVNGRSVDDSLRLKHDYRFLRGLAGILENEGLINGQEAQPAANVDSVEAPIENTKAMRDPRLIRVVRREPDPSIAVWENGNTWNQDEFGPVVVPPGQLFLLGNNRHRSLDSRYLGFVKRSDVEGVMIGTISF